MNKGAACNVDDKQMVDSACQGKHHCKIPMSSFSRCELFSHIRLVWDCVPGEEEKAVVPLGYSAVQPQKQDPKTPSQHQSTNPTHQRTNPQFNQPFHQQFSQRNQHTQQINQHTQQINQHNQQINQRTQQFNQHDHSVTQNNVYNIHQEVHHHVHEHPQQAVTRKAVIVTIGPSTAREKCLAVQSGVTCPRDAGNKLNRVNPDHRDADDVFDVIMKSNGYVCVERKDKQRKIIKRKNGWGMNLQLRCYLG